MGGETTTIDTKKSVTKDNLGEEPWYKRQDILVFVIGQLFFGAIAGAIFGLGKRFYSTMIGGGSC